MSTAANMAEEIADLLYVQSNSGGVGLTQEEIVAVLQKKGFAYARDQFKFAWRYVRTNLQARNDCMYLFDFNVGTYRAIGAVVGLTVADASVSLVPELKAITTRTLNDHRIVAAMSTAFKADNRRADAKRAQRAFRNAAEEMTDLNAAVRALARNASGAE